MKLTGGVSQWLCENPKCWAVRVAVKFSSVVRMVGPLTVYESRYDYAIQLLPFHCSRWRLFQSPPKLVLEEKLLNLFDPFNNYMI